MSNCYFSRYVISVRSPARVTFRGRRGAGGRGRRGGNTDIRNGGFQQNLTYLRWIV